MIVKTDTDEQREVVYSITETIAEATDIDLHELPPLYETIDPDVLGAILQSANDTDARSEPKIEFSYCGFRVTVDSNVRVQLDPEPVADASLSSP